MPAKTPMYLKTSTPRKGKRLKLRDFLSGDQISPPLGDVRHSAHVGAEGRGDMFGDVGFLQGKLDMLPSNGRCHSAEGGDEDDSAHLHALDYSFNGFHYQHAASGLLKTTVSMPVFLAHEQAPPKPPRLHLDEAPPPSLPTQSIRLPMDEAPPPCRPVRTAPEAPRRPEGPPPPLSLCENGAVGRVASEPYRDISLPPAVRKLVPSSGSFSEASSEDSLSEVCGPLDARRGLSLDSDAGLSSEDLRSERSDSPYGPLPLAGLGPASSSAVSRSDSLSRLDLDLGPSILEDVLSIMDRYKMADPRCEL